MTTARDEIVARARFYADECHRIMGEADDTPPGRGPTAAATARRRYDRRMASAGMMQAQALGLLMAAQIIDETPTD